MARLVIQIPCESEGLVLEIFTEGDDIVFSMHAEDLDDAYAGGYARMPIKQFKDMLDKVLSIEPD